MPLQVRRKDPKPQGVGFVSLRCSLARVEGYSEESSSGGEPSAPSRLTTTVGGFSCSGRMMDAWNRSRSGTTCAPSTAVRGLALSMSSAADSPARTSAPQAPALESPASEADSGPRWHGSFAKFNPATSSWKTRQCLLLGGLESFSETWPNYGMMRDGECSAQPALEHPTCESESGFVPTPTANDSSNTANSTANRSNPDSKHHSGTTLVDYIRLWPTPTASLGTKGGRVTPRKGSEGGTLIEAVSARMFPTPTRRDFKSGTSKNGPPDRQGSPALARAGRISWWDAEPTVGRVVDRMAHRVDRLRAIGNGQVPAVARRAWRELA